MAITVQNAFVQKHVNSDSENLAGKWIDDFPTKKDNLSQSIIVAGAHVTEDIADKRYKWLLDLVALNSSGFNSNNTWLDSSMTRFGMKDNAWINSSVVNNAASHRFSLSGENAVVNLNDLWGNPYSNGGYGYAWGEKDITNSLENHNNNTFIRLTGIQHIYSRRHRAADMLVINNTVNDRNIWIRVSDYTRFTHYSDYGGDQSMLAVHGKNNKIIFVLDADFDFWANRTNGEVMLRDVGGGNELIIVNPQHLRMTPHFYNVVRFHSGQQRGFRVGNEDVTRMDFDYSLPWTS